MTSQKIDQQAVHTYLTANARPLDLALYNFYVENSSKKAVAEALAAYQNPDGGFGNGIEPDFQMPQSSTLGTSLTFQYLVKADASADNPLVKRGIAYLLKTYNRQKHGWDIIPKEVNDYPHAPWWEYQQAIASFGWGNPAAEIFGYLLRYRTLVKDAAVLDEITQKALERLHELASLDRPDFHELLCYARLYEQVDQVLQTQLYETLAGLITKAANRNPDEWKSYGATPLTFVKSPQSPFAKLLDKELIEANLNHLEQTIINGDDWEPNWDWAGSYPEAWVQAKREWSGKLTVDNTMILKGFGRL